MSATLPVEFAERPTTESAADCRNLASVTAFVAMVVVMAVVPEPVTSPLSVIVWLAVR